MASIYKSINRWESNQVKQQKLHQSELEENKSDQKTDYIEEGTDNYIVQLFCNRTRATTTFAILSLNEADWNMELALKMWNKMQTFCSVTIATIQEAFLFLKHAEWNEVFAIDQYYQCNGDPFKLHTVFTNIDQVTSDDHIQTEEAVYTEGVQFLYWDSCRHDKSYVKAKYNNLKEEILKFRHITQKIWMLLLEECNTILQSDKIKTILSNGNQQMYGIISNQPITLQHLLSMKLYTDFTQLCKIFCGAFRLQKISKTHYERMSSIKTRNAKIANLAKLLMESVQCYGKFQTRKKKYYRGVDSKYIFKRFVARFNSPTSTTTNFQAAVNFTEGAGLIMELQIYTECMSSSMFGLDVSVTSDFSTEKEILFFGPGSIFQISSIFEWFERKWTSHKKHISNIQTLLNIANGSIQWSNNNSLKEIVAYILPNMYGYKAHLPPYIQQLVKYSLETAPKTIEYDLSERRNEYQWVKDIFWKNACIPNISNACNLFVHSNHFKIRIENMNILSAENCRIMINDALKIKNDNVIIEFEWCAPFAVESFEVKQIKNWFMNASNHPDIRVYAYVTSLRGINVKISKVVKSSVGNSKSLSLSHSDVDVKFLAEKKNIKLLIEDYILTSIQMIIPIDLVSLITKYHPFNLEYVPFNNSATEPYIHDKCCRFADKMPDQIEVGMILQKEWTHIKTYHSELYAALKYCLYESKGY
eukprot:85707_1